MQQCLGIEDAVNAGVEAAAEIVEDVVVEVKVGVKVVRTTDRRRARVKGVRYTRSTRPPDILISPHSRAVAVTGFLEKVHIFVKNPARARGKTTGFQNQINEILDKPRN